MWVLEIFTFCDQICFSRWYDHSRWIQIVDILPMFTLQMWVLEIFTSCDQISPLEAYASRGEYFQYPNFKLWIFSQCLYLAMIDTTGSGSKHKGPWVAKHSWLSTWMRSSFECKLDRSQMRLPSQIKLWVEGRSKTWWLNIASFILFSLLWFLWSRISAITQPLKIRSISKRKKYKSLRVSVDKRLPIKKGANGNFPNFPIKLGIF